MQMLEVGRRQIYALQVRRILVEIDCPVEIRWCPAHEGIDGNEKVDEWANVAAGQPETHGVEWHTIDNRPRCMPPVSLASLSRQVKEKKWEEATGWAYSRITNPSYNVKCRQWRKNRPDPVPAKASKGIASRYYQLKTGHALTGVYLKWIGSRKDDTCWWCQRSGITQTREHLFKTCTAWRQQQKMLWKEVRLQTGLGRDRFWIADMFADERYMEAIIAFLESTDMGQWARQEVRENGSETSPEKDGVGVDIGDEEGSMEVEEEGVGGGGV
jgi:hypothetical protein